MELTQDCVQWRALVLAVLNLRVLPPENMRSRGDGKISLRKFQFFLCVDRMYLTGADIVDTASVSDRTFLPDQLPLVSPRNSLQHGVSLDARQLFDHPVFLYLSS
jgi:hypothetical protein